MGQMESQLMKFTLIIILSFMIDPSSQNPFQLNESAAHDIIKLQKQLIDDLDALLKVDLEKIQWGVGNLTSRLNSSTEVILSLQLQLSLSKNDIDKCEMEAFFYDIDSKLVKVEQNIQQVVNNNEEHMDDTDAIMHNVIKSYFDCSMDEHELFVAFQTNITSKLAEFDRQMEQLNALVQRLIKSDQEEIKIAEANAAMTKLLNEINSKLEGQENKLEKFESFLPLMVNATQSLAAFKENEKARCNKEKYISQKILESTNGQGTTKPLK